MLLYISLNLLNRNSYSVHVKFWFDGEWQDYSYGQLTILVALLGPKLEKVVEINASFEACHSLSPNLTKFLLCF